MVVRRRDRPQQHRATNMKAVGMTLEDCDINLSKRYQSGAQQLICEMMLSGTS
jgi:hypothetical protein